MTREIKFRAWDVRGEQMYEVSQLVSKSSEEGWLCFTPNNPLALAEYTLMQYTGLKDKNGIDIYEGDVVKTKRSVVGMLRPDGKVGEVFGMYDAIHREWDEYRVVEFDIKPNSISLTLPDEDGTYQNRGKKQEWEIVGNIYKNPELITL